MTQASEMIGVQGTPPQVAALFSTRTGGTSVGDFTSLNLGCTVGDSDTAVRANRRAFARQAGFDADRAVSLTQVHGPRLVEAGAAGGEGRFTGDLVGLAEADASVTSATGVALVVQGADCVPVLLWQGDGSRVAAAHAGWRGLVAGVLGSAADGLGGPTTAGAAIGPCIGPCCYPVDAALREQMAMRFGADVVVGEAVDLRVAARRALTAAGVPDGAIADLGGCTSCDARRFFSYRRDGAGTGRQVGVIWRREAA